MAALRLMRWFSRSKPAPSSSETPKLLSPPSRSSEASPQPIDPIADFYLRKEADRCDIPETFQDEFVRWAIRHQITEPTSEQIDQFWEEIGIPESEPDPPGMRAVPLSEWVTIQTELNTLFERLADISSEQQEISKKLDALSATSQTTASALSNFFSLVGVPERPSPTTASGPPRVWDEPEAKA